jgi:AmpE protein
MTFLTVLVTLFIERIARDHRPARRHAWFESYCRWLSGNALAQGPMGRPWGAPLVVLPWVVVVLWLQSWTTSIGAWLALPFGVMVLLLSIGPRDLGDDAEAFLAARDAGDDGEATRLAQTLCLTGVDESEPRRSLAVARALVVLASRQLVAPIFWFVLFGPVGAAAYRMIQLLAERLHDDRCPSSMQRASDAMRHVADWAPARVTAVGYAVAGHFDAVAHAWRNFDYLPDDGPLDEADRLLAETGLAALETFPDDLDEEAADSGLVVDPDLIPPVVEDALALIWRSLAMWVAVIGGGSLIAWIA